MKIENYSCIKLLQLPAGWTEVPSRAGFTPRSMRSFSPAENPDVKIILLNEGVPVSSGASESFRKLLKSAPKMLFERKNDDASTAADKQLIDDLSEVLGNLSNNQVVNKEKGRFGPAFVLERLDTLTLNGRAVLGVRGRFCNPENGKQLTLFCGLFVDVNSQESTCSLEQIYFESEQENLYRQYLPVFETSIRSIEWVF